MDSGVRVRVSGLRADDGICMQITPIGNGVRLIVVASLSLKASIFGPNPSLHPSALRAFFAI